LIVWPQMAVCAGIAVFATILRAWVGADDYIIKDVKGHATLGTALAFLNVFRSNLSYGRYWDGRGQLGVLVKSGRELMRLVVTYSKIPEDEKEEAVSFLHLGRRSGTAPALVRWLTAACSSMRRR
jgi:putative membrane protein